MSGSPLRLVAGLGNLGAQYAGTRHNIGFRIVDAFARRHGIVLDQERWQGQFGLGQVAGQSVACLKPWTLMNGSGRALNLAVDATERIDPARNLIVIHDDLDLGFGRLRLRPSGGAGGHRGVQSIIDSLGRSDFPRLRFGVGRPAGSAGDVIDFVLAPFDEDELAEIGARVEAAVNALETFLLDGIGSAMERFNPLP